jgi:hypothetical protein
MTSLGKDKVYKSEGKESSSTDAKLHEPPGRIMGDESCHSNQFESVARSANAKVRTSDGGC